MKVDRAWFTVGALSLAYFLSAIDRLVPALLLEDIRRDLSITDVQAGLLVGTAFALFYTTAGVPIARLADRWSRRRVILIGVAMWGAMTAYCGFADSFSSFFIARLGVGLGEAALTATSFAIIASLFTLEKRGRAMSIFYIGGSTGASFAFLIGAIVIWMLHALSAAGIGFAAHLAPWRATLFLLGTATLLALIPLSRIQDTTQGPAPPGDSTPAMSILDILKYVWLQRRAFFPFFIAFPFIHVSSYAALTWAPTLLIRNFGWTTEEAGIWLALPPAIVGLGAAYASGWLLDVAVRRRGPGMGLTILAVMSVLSGVLFVWLYFMRSGVEFIILMTVTNATTAYLYVASGALLQSVSPPTVRAQITAFNLLIVNLAGIGFGPVSVGILNDHVFGSAQATPLSMAAVCISTLLIGGVLTVLFTGSFQKTAIEIEGSGLPQVTDSATAGASPIQGEYCENR